MKQELLVIKIGGTDGVNFDRICQEIAEMVKQGHKIIVVHGGSKEANDLGEQVGHPPKFLTSPEGFTSRYTDSGTMEIFCMAVKGKVNTTIVTNLQKYGVNAFGLSGIDGQFLIATRKKAIQSVENGKRKFIRDDFSGKIETVNQSILNFLLESDIVPVIAPLAVSLEGEGLNVDADRVAAMVASAIHADCLMLFTAVKGLYRDFPDEASWISKIKQNELTNVMQYAQGRMKKKILGAQEALAGGVRRVAIADGRVDRPIANAFSGQATWIGAE